MLKGEFYGISWLRWLLLFHSFHGSFFVILISPSLFLKGRGNTRSFEAIVYFKQFLDAAELDDLCFFGNFFSWSNKQDNNPTLRKLDYIVVNQVWITPFSLFEARFLSLVLSDHVLCLMYSIFFQASKESPF